VFCEHVDLPVPELRAATQACYQEKRKAFTFFLNKELGITYIYHHGQNPSPELSDITIAFICMELLNTSKPHSRPQTGWTLTNS
jgi:hypothetical protein